MIKYILISGYGWSGSGLLIDILKENTKYEVIGHEYPLISEPNGILDLESQLIGNWHFLKCDRAIKEFYKFAKKLNKPKSYFHPYGLDLTNNLGIDFISHVENMIEKLKLFEYQGRTRIMSYDKNAIQNFFHRLRWKILDQNKTLMFFSVIEQTKFHEIVQDFHDRIFLNKTSTNTLILDQALPFNKLEKHNDYFKNSKAILVDRDPKDIYADLISSGGLIGQELLKMDDQSIEKFALWYKNQRTRTKIPNTILRVSFEELIQNPTESGSKISAYLGLPVNINNYNFEKSKKNIGLWKNLPSRLIEKVERKINE